jgi:hypothetical protein
MLDLVKSETERIDSRFLEPACGTGNFLAEILERKLRVVEARYGKSQLEFERYAILAVSSIYGIDILEEHLKWAASCRNRRRSMSSPPQIDSVTSRSRTAIATWRPSRRRL